MRCDSHNDEGTTCGWCSLKRRGGRYFHEKRGSTVDSDSKQAVCPQNKSLEAFSFLQKSKKKCHSSKKKEKLTNIKALLQRQKSWPHPSLNWNWNPARHSRPSGGADWCGRAQSTFSLWIYENREIKIQLAWWIIFLMLFHCFLVLF